MGKHTKKGAGGKREGAGGAKPLKYGEKTKVIKGERIPISKEEIFRDWYAKNCKVLIDSLLNSWVNPNKDK
jgi:hypothetical protein